MADVASSCDHRLRLLVDGLTVALTAAGSCRRACALVVAASWHPARPRDGPLRGLPLYGVDATLPFFIPFPSDPAWSGTLRAPSSASASPFPDRSALFDVGIAGPLAGLRGLPARARARRPARRRSCPTGDRRTASRLGEPLLFQWAVRPCCGRDARGHDARASARSGMAAWFGLLVTALNLMPVGQLDGGHVIYALLPRAAPRCVSRVGLRGPAWSSSTSARAGSSGRVLLRVLGRRIRRRSTTRAPSGRGRAWSSACSGSLVFVVCFMPEPDPDLVERLLAGAAARCSR